MCETLVTGTKEVSSFLPFDQLCRRQENHQSPAPSSVILFLDVLIRVLVSPFTNGMTDDQRMDASISYFQLFRYASLSDRLLVLLGAVVSVVAGVAIPLLNINFGHMMDIYIQFDELSDFHQDLLRRPRNYTTFELGFEGMLVEHEVDAMSEIPIEVREFNEKSYMIAFNILAIGFVYFVLCYFFTVILDKTAATIMYRTRLKFYECLLRHEVTWYDESFALAYASDMESKFAIIEDAIGRQIGFFLYMLSTSVCSLLTAVYFGWELTFVLLALTPAFALIFCLVCRSQKNRLTVALKDRQNLNFVVREILSMVRMILSYGGEVKQVLRVDRAIRKSVQSEVRFKVLASVGYGLVWLSNYLTYAVGVWYGSKLIIVSRESGSQDYTAGSIIIVFWNVLCITYFAGRTESFMKTFQSASVAAGEIFHLIQRESCSHVSGIRPNQFSATVQFHGVSLNHALLVDSEAETSGDSDMTSNSWSRTTRKCLKDVSLRVEEGKTLAIIGRPGSGKSLIPKLLTRIIEQQEGTILLGDIEIQNLNLEWLRSNIGYVGKDPFIFDGTVYDNIWLGDKTSIRPTILEAAKNANAFSFIEELSHAGFDTVVGSKGKELTSGQKQRIAIAKALLKSPQILILDQVTSCVPIEEQDDVVVAVEKARLRRTTIIISDHINTNVRNADHILVIKSGQVAEQGSHDDLLRLKGLYRQIWAQQSVREMSGVRLDDDTEQRMSGKEAKDRLTPDPGNDRLEDRADVSPIPYMDAGNEDEAGREEQRQRIHESGEETEECGPQLTTIREESGNDDDVVGDRDDAQDRNDKSVKSDVLKLDLASLTSDSSSISGSIRDKRSRGGQAAATHKYSVHRILKFMERDVLFLLVGGFCSAVFGLGVPLYAILVGEFLTTLQSKDHDQVLQETKLIAGAFVGLSILICMASTASSILFSMAGCRLTQRLRSQAMRSILTQDVDWLSSPFGDSTVRELVTGIMCNDMESVAEMVTVRTASYSQTAGTVIACVVYSLHLNWRMGLVAISLMPFIMYRFRILGDNNSNKNSRTKWSSDSCEETGDKREDLLPHQAEQEMVKTSKKLIQGVRTSSCLQQETQLTPVFRKILQQELQRKDGLLHMRGQGLAVVQCIPVLAYGIVFLFGSHYIQQDMIHYSDFFKIVEGVIFGSILLSEGCLFPAGDRDTKSRIAFLFRVIDSKQLSDASSGFGSIPDGCDGHILFSNVDYPSKTRPSHSLLKSFSLRVDRGSSVAIVSQESGSGQAVAGLIQKLIRPSSGLIQLDGHDVSSMNGSWIRSKVAVISSQPQLLSLSIGENIAFGDNNRYVSFAEVVDAAEAAGVHRFILSLPHAYDTPVHACALTHEQRLRIAVARALIRDPVIVLLEDEGMDGADPLVHQLLPLLKRGRTLISLTRSLGPNVATHDHVVLIEDASVAEEGSHQDLMSRSAHYSDLYKLYE